MFWPSLIILATSRVHSGDSHEEFALTAIGSTAQRLIYVVTTVQSKTSLGTNTGIHSKLRYRKEGYTPALGLL